MRIKREPDLSYWYLEVNDHCFIEPRNDWDDVFALFRRAHNWYNFRFAQIEFELDEVAPGFECTFILLGLGFRLRYNRSWEGTELQAHLDEALQAAEEGRLLSLDEVLSDD